MTCPKHVRWMSLVEGLSLLVLLLVAMPLKYAFDMPIAVRIVGALHGVLFIALIALCLQAVAKKSLTSDLMAKCLMWSVVPFGFVFFDRDTKA